jgi:TRAP-type mannitol/chloroaromatic compound transport system permease large subunit
MMIQTSYLTPPMAPAIFYLKGIAPPEITTNEIFRGIVAYMFLQLIGITIVTIFPQIALWLPDKLIRW